MKGNNVPKKLLYVTYSPYKYEVNRIKTHEMRAKSLWGVFVSPHCSLDPKKTYFLGHWSLRANIFSRGVNTLQKRIFPNFPRSQSHIFTIFRSTWHKICRGYIYSIKENHVERF